MKKKVLSVVLASAMTVAMLAGCGSTKAEAPAAAEPTEAAEEADAASAEASAEETTGDVVVLKCVADMTPHSEILAAAKDALAKQGIEVEVVSNTWSEAWNSMLVDGEVDFAYFMHVPAMEYIEEETGSDLESMGTVHVEPYTCFSNKFETKEELPENAVIAIPNDSTNEYRALKVLEDEGYITLKSDIETGNTTVDSIDTYNMPIEIIEMDQANILPSADDFDAYFVNANRALEAGIDTTKYLMREKSDSDYANIITVTADNKDNENIKKLVEVLKSDEIKQYINDNYKGAVIPAE
ncbi:MAG: MetQ/NlpA family ABC transporter substrate-binding protein [bacterium]|nr:MetQ/NlpA family ABC transporter substrate-binding protein [bacterium]